MLNFLLLALTIALIQLAGAYLRYLPFRGGLTPREGRRLWQLLFTWAVLSISLNTLLLSGVEIGQMGLVHPTVAEKLDKKAAVVWAEVDVPALVAVPAAPIDYRVPSRYPGMEQDLTVYSDTYAPIAEAVRKVNSPLVQGVSVVSTFVDPLGKSISVRISFSHPERTLTGEEVQQVMDAIVAELAEKGISMKK